MVVEYVSSTIATMMVVYRQPFGFFYRSADQVGSEVPSASWVLSTMLAH